MHGLPIRVERREGGVDERINESVLQWFGHIERMENISSAKQVYDGQCKKQTGYFLSIIIIRVISRRAALKALYHRGR